jgi:dihydrofolate reductase
MRKIITGQFISVDGIIENPNELTGRYFNEELGQYLGSGMVQTDALLLGRVTYQEMVPFWADKTGSEDPVAQHMSKPKYVVSTTLENTDDWAHSTLIRDNPTQELARIKQQPGKDILVIGSASLVRWLLREKLLDELDLLVFPVVVGRGKRLFDDVGETMALTLIGSETFSTGVVHLTYRPAAD